MTTHAVPTTIDALDGLPGGLADWFRRATFHEPDWTPQDLADRLAGRRAAVVLPALNEQRTVGAVVEAFMPLTQGHPALVEEIIVMDSGSTDATADVARAAGARVVSREAVLPHVPIRPGKGEVLWRALAATTADLVVYCDADLVGVQPSLVTGLLGPLVTNPAIGFVKAFYDRPMHTSGGPGDTMDRPGTGGGRITELLARPAIAKFAPELAGIIQPLGGEYAGRRDVLTRLPFSSGYAVEIGLLCDIVDKFGIDSIAQVDVGVRNHRHRDLQSLGQASSEVLLSLLARRGNAGVARSGTEEALAGGGARSTGLIQFERGEHGRWQPVVADVEVLERPPMVEFLADVAEPPMAASGA